MANPDTAKSGQPSGSANASMWGNIRKFAILALILGWMVCYFIFIDRVDGRTFAVLAALVFIYIVDLVYSISLSAKASEFFKSFLFQTAVPLTALLVVAFLAYTKVIDSQATMTMFGLALAYTTFVVGKRLRPENGSSPKESAEDAADR